MVCAPAGLTKIQELTRQMEFFYEIGLNKKPKAYIYIAFLESRNENKKISDDSTRIVRTDYPLKTVCCIP